MNASPKDLHRPILSLHRQEAEPPKHPTLIKPHKWFWRTAGIVSLLTALWFCARAGAAVTTRTVTSYADNLGNPFTLRTAISQSQDGDTIVFSEALEGYTINLLNSDLLINCDLSIIGPTNASISIVGGNYTNSPNKRVFRVTTGGGLRTVQISGLQLQGSVLGANGSFGSSGLEPTNGGGGAIFSDTGTLLIVSNCYFAGCRAIGGNGGNAAGGNCVSAQRGGTGASACGGAIYSLGDCFLFNCTFNTNIAVGGDGATGAQGGNGGDAGGGEGGAVCIGYHTGIDLKIVNCTFYDNLAIGGNGGNGGVGYTCTILANPANGGTGGAGGSASGGAMSIDQNDIPTTGSIHSTIYNNFCSLGSPGIGGAGVFGGNDGPPGMAATAAHGCGLYIANRAIPVGNSIFAGNHVLPATALLFGPDVFGPVQSSGFNLVGADDNGGPWAGNDQLGTANTPLDARLAPLQYNGGDMPTVAPLQGSPAIDAGTQAGLPFDQIGQPRPIPVSNRVFPGSDMSDVGAFEIQCDSTAAPPALNLSFSAAALTISWPAPSFCYVLQQSVDLRVWVNSIFPVTTSGTQNQVILNPVPPGPLFFRLIHL